MRFRILGLVLLSASRGRDSANARPPAITRTVVATTKLPTVVAVPLHFSRECHHAARRTTVSREPGVSKIRIDRGLIDGVKTSVLEKGSLSRVEPGVVEGGGSEPSTLLHFLLVPTTDLNQPTEAAPVVKEIYGRLHRDPT